MLTAQSTADGSFCNEEYQRKLLYAVNYSLQNFS